MTELDKQTTTGNVDTKRLNSFIERIETLEEQKKAVQEDIKEVYGEAKAAGYEIKALKYVLKLKAIVENPKLKNKLDEEQYWIDVYKNSLGLD
jgi:uncharacterized protein (UPF0335 family)